MDSNHRPHPCQGCALTRLSYGPTWMAAFQFYWVAGDSGNVGRRSDFSARGPSGALFAKGAHFRGGAYSLQRRNSSAPLVPPKPKEFDMAYSISALRAWLGTKSMSPVSGSWFSRLMVGGMIWLRRASTVMPASRPPAPPSRWPVMDLVELTGIFRAPKKLRIACASSVSPMGVEVPWALT